MRKPVFTLLVVVLLASCSDEKSATTESSSEDSTSTTATTESSPEDSTSTTATTESSPEDSTSTTAAPAGPLIVSNPVDLSNYTQISKFRSCEGHDFSGAGPDGTQESARSMKHYFELKPEFHNTEQTVQVFAPFDGSVDRIEPDQRGTRIYFKSEKQSEWQFIYFHSDAADGVKQGSKVKSGQLIGYANLTGGENFDMTLSKQGGPAREAWDSMFDHMAPEVLQQFAAAGVTPEDIIVSKSERDAAPCASFERSEDNWVVLTG